MTGIFSESDIQTRQWMHVAFASDGSKFMAIINGEVETTTRVRPVFCLNLYCIP